MTDLSDIYVAAGGTRNEDGSVIIASPGQLKPFKIELEVLIEEISWESGRQPQVTFRIPLHDEFSFGESTYGGTPVFHYENGASVTLPVDQIKIIVDEE